MKAARLAVTAASIAVISGCSLAFGWKDLVGLAPTHDASLGADADASNDADLSTSDGSTIDASTTDVPELYMHTENRSPPSGSGVQASDALMLNVSSGFPIDNQAMTTELWVRARLPVVCVSVYCDIVSFGAGTYGQRTILIRSTHRLEATSNGASIVSTHTLDDGAWHHLALVIDPAPADGGTQLATWSFYLDAALDVTGVLATRTRDATDRLVVGAGYGIENGVAGDYAEVRVWNRALSQSEIAMYWQRQRGPSTPGLLVYYRMRSRIGAPLGRGSDVRVANLAPSGATYDGVTVGGDFIEPLLPSFEVGGPGVGPP